MRRRLPLAGALAALSLAARAAEGDAPPAAPDATAPEPPAPRYEATIRAPARLADTWSKGDGVTVQVIDAKELRESGAQTVQEALQRLPGVHVADEQGNPYQLDLVTRGFSASPVTGLSQGVSVFLDGVRINEPAVEEVNFDLVPLADVERIEVVRGPNAIFGRNTLGAAIHIITRRGGAAPEAEAEVEAGSALRQEVRARASGPLGPLDGYVSLSEGHDPGWRVAGASRALRGFAKVGARGDDGDVSLSYQYQVDRLGQPGSLPAPLLRLDRTANYTPGDFFEPSLHLVTLNARERLSPGLSVAGNAFFRALDAEQFNSSFIAADTRLFDTTRSFGATVEVDHRARLGALRNRLTAGAEVARNTVRVAVHQEANARFDASSEDGLPLPRVTSDVRDAQLALGAFVQEHARIASGPLAGLAATLALRADRIGHDIVDASPDDRGKATGRTAATGLEPGAGLAYAFAPGWLASASWSQGFRAPAFLEITCGDPGAPCIGLQAGVAPDTSFRPLRPVRSRAWEAALTAPVAPHLTATATAYRVDLLQDIFSVTAPGTTFVFFQNVGSTRREGAELTLRYDRAPLDLQASYAYTRATFQSDLTLATPRTDDGTEQVRRGAELPLVPNHRVDLDARVRALRWLTLGAGVAYVGPQWFRGDEANLGPRLPGYVVARAGAEARWRRFTASLRLTNLFDARYETFGTFAPNGKAPGQPVQPFLTPGPPLRLAAGLRWELG